MITVRALADLPAIPSGADRADIYLGEIWFRCVLAHAMPAGSTPVFLAAGTGERVLGLLALRRHGKAAASLTTPYSCLFRPMLAADLDAHDRAAVCRALARACRAWPVITLDTLDPLDRDVREFIAAARSVGLAVRPYRHVGNWHEAVAGLGWEAYLARRPAQLRNTIRRRAAAAMRDGCVCTIASGGHDLDAAIAAYHQVYARSWKEPEPFPDFNQALMRAIAPTGGLRLGLLHRQGQPLAAQIWLVEPGKATVVKLAHDEAFKALSPGTVLTAHMIRHLLDEEKIAELDFGRGDDAYKRAWAQARRQRIGLLLADPRKPAGLAALGRQILSDMARRLYRRHSPDSAG